MAIPTQSFYSSTYHRSANSAMAASLDAETSTSGNFSVDIASHGFHVCQQCSCSWCLQQFTASSTDSSEIKSSNCPGGSSAIKSVKFLQELPPLKKIFSIQCRADYRHIVVDHSMVQEISNQLVIPLKSKLIFDNLPLDHIFHLDPEACKCFICSAYAKHNMIPVPKQWGARLFTHMQYDDPPVQTVVEMKCFKGSIIPAYTRGPFPTFSLFGHVFHICQACSCPTCDVLTSESIQPYYSQVMADLKYKSGGIRWCSCLVYPRGTIIHKPPKNQVAFMNRDFDEESKFQARAYTKNHLFHIALDCPCDICSSYYNEPFFKIPGPWYGRAFVYTKLIDRTLEGLSLVEVREIAQKREMEEQRLALTQPPMYFASQMNLIERDLRNFHQMISNPSGPPSADGHGECSHQSESHPSESTIELEAPETDRDPDELQQQQQGGPGQNGKPKDEAKKKKKKPAGNKKKGKKKGRK